jgi:hypothetical protein
MSDQFECHRALRRELALDALSHEATELVFWAGMRGGDCNPCAKRRASVFGSLRGEE